MSAVAARGREVMGNFYTSFTMRTEDRTRVAAVRGELARTAYVASPHDGWTVVFDRACDEQDTREIVRLGSDLQ